ncbi:UNVERIFIED_CONTAM: hypothetical protein HDU68_011377 [Siphonaria sp. JEL0065]|nr:hypothetical protein HDU68_011377 [Siphonaria sp. JEL0065]
MSLNPQSAHNARLPHTGTKNGKGEDTMDWGRLKASGADMRGGVTYVRNYTLEEVAGHRKQTDLWMAIHGKIYCCSQYVAYHPGGITQLMRGAGKDATELFMRAHPWVDAHALFGEKCLVGYLVATIPKITNSKTQIIATPIRSPAKPKAQDQQLQHPTEGFAWKPILPMDPKWKSARENESINLNATILVNKELQNTAQSQRSTRHLEVLVSEPFIPGDYLEVYPQNDPSLVKSIAQAFGASLDATFVVMKSNVPFKSATVLSLEANRPMTLRPNSIRKSQISS